MRATVEEKDSGEDHFECPDAHISCSCSQKHPVELNKRKKYVLFIIIIYNNYKLLIIIISARITEHILNVKFFTEPFP